MPFKKVGTDDYVSPSGKHWTKKQMIAYYASGGFKKDKMAEVMAPTDAENELCGTYMCDCGQSEKFEGNEAPSRCMSCGRDVDTRKIKKAGLAPVPANLWPTYGADAPPAGEVAMSSKAPLRKR